MSLDHSPGPTSLPLAIIYSAAYNSDVKEVRKLALTFWLTLPVFYGLWLFFTGTFSLHELEIGILAALLASAGMVVVANYYSVPFSPTAKDLLALWRLPWYLLSGTWEVFFVAARDLVGSKGAKSVFRISPFDAGSKDDPRRTARRLLAVLYTTIAPNFIVVGINASDQKMLFHQIERSSVPKMTRQLGAEA